jgi:hypothetical protein
VGVGRLTMVYGLLKAYHRAESEIIAIYIARRVTEKRKCRNAGYVL